MTGFSVESNIKAVAAKMQRKAKNVEKAVKDGVEAAAKYGVQQEKALVTPHKKTGKTLTGITAVKTGDYTYTLNLALPDHAKYLEKGRGPVKVKNAKALRFEIKGQVLFRKSVGPAKARPFVEPTRKALKIMYPKIMETEINKALRS